MSLNMGDDDDVFTGGSDIDTLERTMYHNGERNISTDNGNFATRKNFVQAEPEDNEAWLVHEVQWDLSLDHEDESSLNTSDLQVPIIAILTADDTPPWPDQANLDAELDQAFNQIDRIDGAFAMVVDDQMGATYDQTNSIGADGEYQHYEETVNFTNQYGKPYLVLESGDMNVHWLAASTVAGGDVNGDNELQAYTAINVVYERLDVDPTAAIQTDIHLD